MAPKKTTCVEIHPVKSRSSVRFVGEEKSCSNENYSRTSSPPFPQKERKKSSPFLQGGPLPVISRAITPLIRVITPYPFIMPFIGVIFQKQKIGEGAYSSSPVHPTRPSLPPTRPPMGDIQSRPSRVVGCPRSYVTYHRLVGCSFLGGCFTG